MYRYLRRVEQQHREALDARDVPPVAADFVGLGGLGGVLALGLAVKDGGQQRFGRAALLTAAASTRFPRQRLQPRGLSGSHHRVGHLRRPEALLRHIRLIRELRYIWKHRKRRQISARVPRILAPRSLRDYTLPPRDRRAIPATNSMIAILRNLSGAGDILPPLTDRQFSAMITIMLMFSFSGLGRKDSSTASSGSRSYATDDVTLLQCKQGRDVNVFSSAQDDFVLKFEHKAQK